jgi:hypothetical protein
MAQAFESARARGGVRLALAAGALAAAGLALYFGWRRLGGPQLLGGGLSRRRAPCPRLPGPGCAPAAGRRRPAGARPACACMPDLQPASPGLKLGLRPAHALTQSFQGLLFLASAPN